MKPFNAYSKYYDVLYGDKNYESEATYLTSIFNRHEVRSKSEILEIGCGTGKHAKALLEKGFQVHGIDQSQGMVEQARQRVPSGNFAVAEATSFSLPNQKFAAAFSFFHVMSYLQSPAELKKAASRVSEHLASGGLFVFDCWNLPAVKKDPPVVRFKKMSDDEVDVFRTANPHFDHVTNVVTVEFFIWVHAKGHSAGTMIHETHRMRPFSKSEIVEVLAGCGFELVTSEAWLGGPLTDDDWYATYVARKR